MLVVKQWAKAPAVCCLNTCNADHVATQGKENAEVSGAGCGGGGGALLRLRVVM